MANKVVIDVEARFTDNISSGVKSAQKAIDALGKSVDELQGKLNGAGMKIPSTPSLPSPPGQKTPSAPSQKSSGKKTYKPIFDADNSRFLRKIRDMEAKAQRLGHTKTAMVLEAVDKATNVIGKVMNAAQKFGHLTAEAALKVNDMGMRVVQKTSSALRSVTSKVWTTTLRVKDFVTAPIRKLKESLFSVKNLVAAIATGMAFKKFVVDPVGMYAGYEDLVTQFSVLLGSQDAARKRMQDLVTFAGKTPFTRDEIFQASRILQTYTGGALATPEATGGLTMIGDVAAATGTEYVQTATYFGQLYNEVKRGGESMGEPLMRLREIGALSAEAEEKIKEIATGSGTIETKWAAIAQQFTKTDGMMEAMSDQMNNLLLGVKTFVKNNLWMKLGEGISASLKPFLSDFRKWRSENSALIADWAVRIKDTAQILSGKVLGAVRSISSKVQGIMKTPEWAEAGFLGKLNLLRKGLITDPLTEWWNGGGREKTIQAAGKIGAEMGSLLSKALVGLFRGIGLLTDRGSELAGAGMEAGSSVAGAFIQGFLANFDTGAIAGAFKDVVLGIWDAMPTWGKVLAGIMAGNKIFGAGAKVLGGVKDFWGSAGEVVDEAGNVLDVVEGASGLRGLIGHAGRYVTQTDNQGNQSTVWSAGSGLAKLGTKAYQLFRGAEAADALISSSPVLASGLGLAGVAGGVVGGATAIKGGFDIYHGIKEDDDVKAGSGLMKVGGVGAGALMGAAIGSVVPVLGTAIGAAIGAGVGGIASWFGSSHYEKRMKAANFESQEMKDAIMDSAASAEDLDRTFQKVVAQNLEDHFGDIRLSMDEIARLSDQLVWGDDKAAFEKFTSAANDAKSSLTALNNAGKATEKWMWKASLGVKFDETEQADIKASFQSYIDSAQSYIENQHYTFTAAVGVLFEPEDPRGKGILDTGGKWYTQTEEKAQKLGAELQEKIETALKGDGIITDQEWEAIMHVQVQIDDVTSEVNEAEEQARRMMMESMFKGGKLHLSGGAMDATSYQRLMEMNNTNIGEKQTGYYETAVSALTGIQGAYNAGNLTPEQRKTQITDAFNAYKSQIAGLRGETIDFQVDLISDTYAKELGEGAAAKVWKGLDDALQNKTDPITWSDDQVRSMLELPKEVPQEAVENLRTMLSTAFGQINPLEVDNSLLDSWLGFDPEAWENLDPMDVKRTVNETFEQGEVSTESLAGQISSATQGKLDGLFGSPIQEEQTVDTTLKQGEVSTEGMTRDLQAETPELSPIERDQEVDVKFKPTLLDSSGLAYGLDGSGLPNLPAQTLERDITVSDNVVNESNITPEELTKDIPEQVDTTTTANVTLDTKIVNGSGDGSNIVIPSPDQLISWNLLHPEPQTVTVPLNVETEIVNGSGSGDGDGLLTKLASGLADTVSKTINVDITANPTVVNGAGGEELSARLTGDFPDTVSKSVALDITADPVTVSGAGGEDLPARLTGGFPDTVSKAVTVDVTTNANVVSGSGDVAAQVQATVPDTVSKTVNVEVTANPVVLNGSGDTAALARENVPANVTANTAVRIAASYSVSPKLTDTRVKTLAGVKSSYSFSAKATLNVSWTVNGKPPKIGPSGGGFRGGIFGGSSAMDSFARGGLVSTKSAQRFSDGGVVQGGPKLIQVAEEGSPEMVIPLSSQRRDRGRKLWEKAGHMLKVPGFARGGLTDGSPMDERPFGSKGKLGSILQRIDALVEKLLTTKTQNIAKELQSLGQGGNVDLLNRPIVDASILRDVGWDDTGEGKATVFSSTFSDEAGTKAINFTPIIVDQQGNFIDVLEPGSLAEYAEGVIQGVQDDYLSLQIGAAFTGDDAIQQAESAAERIHSLQEEYYLSPHLNTNRKLGDLLRIPDLFSAGRTSLPNVWQTSSAMTDDRFGVRVEDDPIPRRERHPRAIPYNSPEEILQSGTRSTSEAAAGPGDVHVEMGGITVNLTIQVNGGGNVVDEIKAQMGEIRDAVADALTDSLGAGFANTPLRGGLAG